MGKTRWWRKPARSANRYASFQACEDPGIPSTMAPAQVKLSTGRSDLATTAHRSQCEPRRTVSATSKRAKWWQRCLMCFRGGCFGVCTKKKRQPSRNVGGTGASGTAKVKCNCCNVPFLRSDLLSCHRGRWCSHRSGCCTNHDEEEDDVDAAFALYRTQLAVNGCGLSEPSQEQHDRTASPSDYDALSASQRSTIRKLHRNAHWDWYDSFRSFSDRFLETLELDDDGASLSSRDGGGPVAAGLSRRPFRVCCRQRLELPFRDRRGEVLGEIQIGARTSLDRSRLCRIAPERDTRNAHGLGAHSSMAAHTSTKPLHALHTVSTN